MLIGICGGICAGKHAVQEYLIRKHKFEPLGIVRNKATPRIEKSANEAHVPSASEPTLNVPRFDSVDGLLEYTTKRWRENFVTTDIHDEATAQALAHRPFFVLVHVNAPISVRWARFRERCSNAGLAAPSLEQFVLRDDDHQYDPTTRLSTLASRAHIKLLNASSSLRRLEASLDAINLLDETRMRPTWDHYFMTLASLAARRSNCMRRQVGCVLVREKRVMSTGYNGTPRNVTNCNEGGCPRCNGKMGGGGAALSTCLCLHAEENALLEAGRERVGAGAVLYCNTCPCLTCSVKIVQVGIQEVVFSQSYYMDSDAAQLFAQAGIKLRQFSVPEEGLIDISDDILDAVVNHG